MLQFGQGQVHAIDAQTLKQGLAQNAVILIDVREPAEFSAEHIPGAMLVPLSRFDPRKIPQPQGKQLVLYCHSAARSAIAAQKLLNAGFSQVAHLSGGIIAWKQAGLPTER
ncbi:MAG TPA: rhodanese-like domain-containing protein [Synechococcales cyanobacterium M55_K2018_004]|nr:rhodanese-like domain-containing protein [Synechococcales cyanobacterium M55_K2018_004]